MPQDGPGTPPPETLRALFGGSSARVAATRSLSFVQPLPTPRTDLQEHNPLKYSRRMGHPDRRRTRVSDSKLADNTPGCPKCDTRWVRAACA